MGAGPGNGTSQPKLDPMPASHSWTPTTRPTPFLPSSRSKVQMQPQAVSRTSAPNVRPTAAAWRGSNSRTVQPMIVLAKKDGVDSLQDYAVLKVLHQLVQHEQNAGKPTGIQDLVAADFRNVAAGETL